MIYLWIYLGLMLTGFVLTLHAIWEERDVKLNHIFMALVASPLLPPIWLIIFSIWLTEELEWEKFNVTVIGKRKP